MSLSVDVQNSADDVNLFQRYLIPTESRWVRFTMMKASECAREGNIFTSRVYSVALAIGAVVMSFFNAVSYLFGMPFRFGLHIFHFDPFNAFVDLGEDVTAVLRSLVFVSLGVTFVVAGLLFPEAIFTHFAPEDEGNEKERLQQEIERLAEENKELEKMLTTAIGNQVEDIRLAHDAVAGVAVDRQELQALRTERDELQTRLGELQNRGFWERLRNQ